MPELTEGLADAVRGWLQTHDDLTQAVISSRGGPSSTTLTKILSGRGTVRPKVIADLDRGLGWGVGVAQAALDGSPVSLRGGSLADVPDVVLLAELGRRLARSTEAGQATGPDPDAEVVDLPRMYEVPPGHRSSAARNGRKSAIDDDDNGLIDETTGQDEAGEENQDGPDEPA